MPFEIPENWVWVEMSDIFLLNPKNDFNDNVDGGFIPMACVCDGYSGEHTFITKQWGDIKKGFSHFQNGDIGIAKISPCFENRKSVIFSDLPNNIGSGTTELVVLRGILVNSAFYLLLIKSDWYISEGTKYFKGVVGQQRVHKDIFTTLQVPMPPLREQQKIVDSVKNWFSVIDEIENGVTELETVIKQAKSKILDLAISGKLVPQDPEDEPAIELLKRINPAFKPCDNSHYENLPQGWTVCKIKDIFNITMGQSPTGESINGVKGIEFHQGKIHFTESYLSQSGVYTDQPTKIAEVDSLLLCVRAPVGVLNITQRKICIGRGLCALKPKYEIDNLYWLFILTAYKDYFESNATGSTFKAISGDTIKNAVIKLPPLQEQKRILYSIISLYESLDAITAEL